jgi:hypothetical protein
MHTMNTSPTRYITLDQRDGLVFLYSRTLPEDGTPVPKHVGDSQLSRNLFYELYFIVFY